VPRQFDRRKRRQGRVPTIGYESPFVSLADTLPDIAAALEAKGWPKRATGAAATHGAVSAARHDFEQAGRLLAESKAKAKRNPIFEPMVERATCVLENAKRRLGSALELDKKARSEPSRLSSHDEAWRQLCRACHDGAITALSDDGEVPVAAFFCPDSPQDCRLHNEIRTPTRCYSNVKFYDSEITRLWPMPPPDADRLERASSWMLDHAKAEAGLGRKVKKIAAVRMCMDETGATWRQAEKAYDELPPECKNKPRGRC
jgi:hypothetical protein